MTAGRLDPYETLGVRPGISDKELRATYRRLVQLHHPDHNGGSVESARRFEEVQEAYAQIRQLRDTGSRTRPAPPRASDPATDARLADLEREIREAHLARERARERARQAAAAATGSARRPSPEELGYITTDDSLASILADARSQASERIAEVREPVTKRVADLLDGLASKLSGEPPPRSRE
jgi:hypothetical protein